LSGLNQIQNEFQNLLENGFEKLEKEKEKGNQFHSEFGPFLPQPSARGPPLFPASASACPPRARPAFPRSPLHFVCRAQPWPPVPPVSDTSPFPFSFLQFFPTASAAFLFPPSRI
jgi:hypothetical protein